MEQRICSVGVFDSGYGGLSILKHLAEKLPHYRYVYLGDNARAPYGDKSPEDVEAFTRQGVEFLRKENCELIIVACNTASAEALQAIQRDFLKRQIDTKVLGVIVPAAQEAVELTKNHRFGLLATEGTVRSKAFVREIEKLDEHAQVFQKAAPLLVPLVEYGAHTSLEAKKLLEEYVRPLLSEDIDTLILGCTHYEHMERDVLAIIGEKVHLVSEGALVARKLEEYLTRHPEVEEKLRVDSGVQFYTTGQLDRFENLGASFFGDSISAMKANLSD